MHNQDTKYLLAGSNMRSLLLLPSITASEQKNGILQDVRGEFLLTSLKAAGMDIEDIGITYAVPKRLQSNSEPSIDIVKSNISYVQTLIQKHRIQKIGVVGETVGSFYSGITDFSRYSGFALHSPVFNIPVFVFGKVPQKKQIYRTKKFKYAIKGFTHFVKDSYKEYTKKHFHIITDIDELEQVLILLEKDSVYIEYDFETTGVDLFKDIPHGLGLCGGGDSYYIPLNENPAVEERYPDIYKPDQTEQHSLFHVENKFVPYWGNKQSLVLALLWKYIFSTEKQKTAHNAKYDYSVAYSLFKKWPINSTHCTMLMAHSFDCGIQHPLDSFLWEMPHIAEYQAVVDKFHLAGKKIRPGKNKKKKEEGMNYRYIPTKINGKYCCGDVHAGHKIVPKLMESVNTQPRRRELYNLYNQLGEIYSKTQFYGLRVDLDWHNNLIEEYAPKIEALSKAGKEKYGININSPAKVADILYGKFKLPPIKENTTGYSSDKEVLATHLEQIALKDVLNQKDKDVKEFIETVLAFKTDTFFYSTFVSGLSTHIYNDDKVHPNTNINPARSARTSMANPNLQNQIQRNEKLRKLVKGQFIPEPGKSFNEIDASKAEVCVAAFLSGDQVFIDALRVGDFYVNVGCLIYRCKPADIDLDMRNNVLKPVVLANQYLSGAKTMMVNINANVKDESKRITLAESRQIQELMRRQFPVFFRWRDEQVTYAERNHKIRNYFYQYRRGVHTGQLFNSIIQGTTSHFIQKCIADYYYKELKEQECWPDIPRTFFNMNVHDAAYYQTPIGEEQKLFDGFNGVSQEYLNSIGFDFMKFELTTYAERWGHK